MSTEQSITQSILNKSRKDKFILTIVLPEALKNLNKRDTRSNSNVNLDSIQFSVWGSVVPKNEIPAEDIRYDGANIYVSSHSKPSYDPVSVNFTIDNRFNNYWIINKWINLNRDKDGVFVPEFKPKNVGVGLYSADFVLTSKDEYNNDVIQWVYESAFPVSLGSIDFSDRDSDEN